MTTQGNEEWHRLEAARLKAEEVLADAIELEKVWWAAPKARRAQVQCRTVVAACLLAQRELKREIN